MMKRRLLFLTMIGLMGLAVVGCDDDTDNTQDAAIDMPAIGDLEDGTSPLPDDGTPPCTSDDACPGTQICDGGACLPGCDINGCDEGACDQTTGRCIDASACSAASDCADAELCNGCRGVCEDLPAGARVCEEDSNCFSEDYCDPCLKICTPKAALCEECTFHAQCGTANDLCVDLANGSRVCGQACERDNQCPDGFRCADNGSEKQCLPASGDCGAPSECSEDNDCSEANEICVKGRCNPGCTPGGCPNNLVCDAGNCLESCETRGCDAPRECDAASGTCKFPGECLSSRDCTEPETYCDTATDRCVPGCQEDDDCRSGFLECVNGSCETRGCEGAFSCAFDQVCEASTGMCKEAEGPHCDTCDASQEMPCGTGAECLSLEDKDGNPVGDFCFVECSDDPLNECPQGYKCTELQDQDGNPAGEVCFRDCTVDPFG